MSGYPPILVRHPRPYDLVDDPVHIVGIGTGFEGVFQARVRDGSGAEIATGPIHAGGTGIWGNFQISLGLGGVPSTPQGSVEVFEISQAGDGSELNKVIVPITFGTALVNPYHGFTQYTVVPGDSLSAIAQQFYGDPAQWTLLFEANRHQISNPNLIFPGQVLRVPQ